MLEKIALFVPSLSGGGAERVMVNLARGFRERDIAVDLVLVRAEGPYMSEIASGVNVVELDVERMRWVVFALARYLRKNRPSALISTLTHANIIALWANRLSGTSTRVIVREANVISYSLQKSEYWWQRIIPRLMRHCYPWADAIVANSQSSAEDLARIASLSLNRIRVIHNPVITPDLFIRAKRPLNHPWFIPGAPPVILGTGRLHRQKDFPTLIQAFARLLQNCPARLMILGEGNERHNLESLVCELGLESNIALPGFVDNPFAYMARSSVFVLSSVWEGLPNVLIQALATGTPVVSTDCPGGPSEILEDGKYGQLVPVGDVNALAEAILATLSNQPNRERLRARAMMFTADRAVNQFLKVIGINKNLR